MSNDIKRKRNKVVLGVSNWISPGWQLYPYIISIVFNINNGKTKITTSKREDQTDEDGESCMIHELEIGKITSTKI